MQTGKIVQLTIVEPNLRSPMKELEDLQRQFNELQGLYEHVSSDRQVYIHLWEQVPIKQRLAIHEALNKKEGLFQEF